MNVKQFVVMVVGVSGTGAVGYWLGHVLRPIGIPVGMVFGLGVGFFVLGPLYGSFGD